MNKREIKFRVWHPLLRKMVYPDVIQFARGSFDRMWGSGYKWTSDVDSDVVVTQFTDFKDHNGKEIYEGDIVQLQDLNKWDPKWLGEFPNAQGRGVVTYVRGAGEYWVYLDKFAYRDYYSREFLRLRDVEFADDDCEIGSNDLVVIGNIFENEDMLTDKNDGL